MLQHFNKRSSTLNIRKQEEACDFISYRAAHVDDGISRPENTRRLGRQCKSTRHVRTELDRNANSHDEVDQRESIERDGPEVHQSEHAQNNHRNRPDDDRRRPDVEAKENYRDGEYRSQTDAEVENGVVDDGQVLLVEYVEHALNIHTWHAIRYNTTKTNLIYVAHLSEKWQQCSDHS